MSRGTVCALPLHQRAEVIGGFVLVHDAGYIRGESLRVWRETFPRALAHVFLIVMITLLIVRSSIAGPVARTAQWRALRTGQVHIRQAESLSQARSAAAVLNNEKASAILSCA